MVSNTPEDAEGVPRSLARAVVLLREARTFTDSSLVRECQAGDSTAFDEIVRRYKDRVCAFLYRFLGDREDALDVAQEVFVRAYRGIDGFRGSARIYTWLYSIAANLARNRLRDRGRKGRDQVVSLEALALSAASDAASTHATPRDAAERNEFHETLQQCLEELPEHCRLAFVLRTFDDMSYDEIGEVLGCPSGTVKSRIHQARQLLRERLRGISVA